MTAATTKKTKIVKKEKSKTTKGHYVKNAELLEAWHEAKAIGKLTDRLARYLYLVAERYSYHPWFAGYSFREDLVANAAVNLCANWHKFNPEKSDNPFSYFTTSSYRSFQAFLANEKKERDIRDVLLVEAGANPSFNYQSTSGSGKLSDDTAFTGASSLED